MKETFSHTFSNGLKMTLIVTADDHGIYMVANPIDLTGLDDEYNRWLNEVVVPEVTARLTPAQIAIAAKYGVTQIKKDPEKA